MSAAGAVPIKDPNIVHALDVLELFFEPGDAIELRGLDVDRPGCVYAGYFEMANKAAIANAIRAVDGRASGVYFVLNRINPALLARSANRLKPKPKNTTTDADILERRDLYVDCDAGRPAGISATDAEHQAALDRAQRIRDYLGERGWPEPFYADSGNGGHLHYRLPLLDPQKADGLVKGCLEALAARFDDEAVKVDVTTSNRSRICKLYGTMVRKGDNTPERPHRRAMGLGGPEHFEAVPVELLEQLAAEAPQRDQKRSDGGEHRARRSFDVTAWLAQSGLEILKGPEPYDGGRRWTLGICPFNSEHAKPVIIELATGALVYKCLHKSCASNDWHALRNLIDPNRAHGKQKQNGKQGWPDADDNDDGKSWTNGKASDEASRIDIDRIPTIGSFDSAGIGFAIEALIARGSVTMLSAESGQGKSTLALAMGDSIAKGRNFAGRKCSRRPVLILDRENGIDVMQERFARLGIEDESGLIVWGGWLEKEAPVPGAPVVLEWVQKTEPKPVVIVDTLVAFLKGDENNASEVREFMGQLRQLANLGATVIALHHTGKAETSHDYRGSSDFKGSIDVGINVRNFGETELGKMRLKAFKARFAIDREIILNYSKGCFVSDDRPNSAARTVTEQLTDLLRRNPGTSKLEFEKLANSHGLGRNRGRMFLDDGVGNGEIQLVKGEKNAKFYHLAESGLYEQ